MLLYFADIRVFSKIKIFRNIALVKMSPTETRVVLILFQFATNAMNNLQFFHLKQRLKGNYESNLATHLAVFT